MTARTPWFKANVKPAYVGFYERGYDSPKFLDLMPDRWDGKCWILVGPTGSDLCKAAQPIRWRGLADKP